MLQNDLKNDIEKTLQAHCPEPPEGFAERMDNKAISLMQKKHNQNVNKGRSRYRLPVLVAAAVLVLCFVTATSRDLMIRPDEIRARETTTPLVTALSEGGQETVPGGSSDEDPVTKALREEIDNWVISSEDIVQELKPVNLSFETQGIRVEILSALVKGTELWVVYSAQDLEGDRISSYTRDSEFEYVSVNQTNYTPENETYATLVFSEEEKKITYVRRFGFDQRIESENGMIELEFGKFLLIHDETVDLTGYLRQYGSRAKGVKPPEGAKGSGGFLMDETKVSWKDAKVLDFSNPLDIQVFKDIYLTGIGWTDDQVHAQFRCTDREEYTDAIPDGYLSVGILPEFSEVKNFMGYGTIEWKPEDGSNTKWMDQTVNCTREEAESMKLSADVMEYVGTVDDSWTIQIPYDEIKAGFGTDAGSEYSPEEIIRSCLWLFTAHWSKGNTAYMLNLCADEWKETRQDPEQAVRKLMESGKPRGIAFNSISGENGDPTRTVDVTVQWEGKDGGYTYSRHEITVRWQQITQEYLIDPEGFETGVAAQPVADEELNLVTEEALIRNTMEAHIPEVSYDELIPISGLSTEKQGMRLEAVSGCVKGDKAYILCTLQNVDGKYDGLEIQGAAVLNEDGNISVSCPRIYESKRDNKTAWLYKIKQPGLLQSGKDSLAVKMDTIYVRDEKRIDLMPFLKEYGNNAGTAEPPDHYVQLPGMKYPETGKILDYKHPLDISLWDGAELTGIGWIDGRLHVQVHVSAEPVETSNGVGDMVPASLSINTTVNDEIYRPLEWYDDNGDEYQEYILDVKPEDMEQATLTATILKQKAWLTDNWELQIPIDMLLPETDVVTAAQKGETEEAESLTLEEKISRKLEEYWPEIAKELKPVNLNCEKEGFRAEVIYALIKDQKLYVVYSLQDLEGDRIKDNPSTYYLDNLGGTGLDSIRMDWDETEEHKATFLKVYDIPEPVQPDGKLVVNLIGLMTEEVTTIDLLPLLKKYGKTVEGVDKPEDTLAETLDWSTGSFANVDLSKYPTILDYTQPLDETLCGPVSLTGMGWIDNKLHVQIHNPDETTCTMGNTTYLSWMGSPRLAITEGEDSRNPAYDELSWGAFSNGETAWKKYAEYVWEIAPDDINHLELKADIYHYKKISDTTWKIEIPIASILPETDVDTAVQEEAAETANPLSIEEEVNRKIEEKWPGITKELKPVNFSCEKQGIRLEVTSALVKGNEAWAVYTLEDMTGDHGAPEEGYCVGGYEKDTEGKEPKTETYLLQRTSETGRRQIYIKHIEAKNPLRTEKDAFTVGIEQVCVSRYKQIDLIPFLKEYGKNEEGIELPELHPAFSKTAREGMKILDYTQPLDISLLENVKLTGIGWIDDQLHTQIHFTAEPIRTSDGVGHSGAGVNIHDSVSSEGVVWPLGWDDNGDEFPDWMESVIDVRQEDAEDLRLTAEVWENKEIVEDDWEVRIPLEEVLAEGEVITE